MRLFGRGFARLRTENEKQLGRHLSRHTGMYWLQLISQRLKFGPKVVLSHFIFYSPWNSRHVVCTWLPAQRPFGDNFMKQIARNLTDPFDGFLNGKKSVLMDRDANFSYAFRTILKEAGAEPVRLPPKSPNLNGHLERYFRSLKSEALDHMIFFGEHSLRRAVGSYVKHYHEERNHQGLDNKIIDPNDGVITITSKIECDERLGGTLKYYHRAAA